MKLGLVYCSGFKRLPAHAGATKRLREAEKAGLIPRPHFITGSSAGAIASAAFLPWTDKSLDQATETIINLKPSDIFSIWRLTELCGALTLGESFLNFIPPLTHNFYQTRQGQITIEVIRSAISLAAKGSLFYELLEQPSIFSSEPLRKLLKESEHRLDFKSIWNSDIKLEIPAVDLKSAQMVYFTNYLPKHRQQPNRDNVLVDMVRASASVPAFLQTIFLGGRLLDDAALLNSIPLDRAMQAGCDVIFVFMLRPYLEPSDNFKDKKVNWVEELNRAMDLAIGRSTELTLQWHEKINQDLEIIEKLEKMEYANGPVKALLSKLSAYGLKKTKIIPVWSDEPLPNLTFTKFSRTEMEKGVEIGYRAMAKTLEQF